MINTLHDNSSNYDITSPLYLDKYVVKFINFHRRDNDTFYRDYYDVKILNVHTKEYVVISDFSPSPLRSNPFEQKDDALSMIVSMAIEWKDDNRTEVDDNGINPFEYCYDKLHTLMSDDEIDDLNLYFYDKENNILNADDLSNV